MIQIREGDSTKCLVTVKKIKKGVPTVIMVAGRTYTLQAPNHDAAAKAGGGVKRGRNSGN